MKVVQRIVKGMYRCFRKFFKIKIKRTICGYNNDIIIDRSLTGGTLYIFISGNNNKIIVGKNCWFGGCNRFFVVGDNNVIKIGDNVTFDEKVDFVIGEGTKCVIGDDCMLAAHTLFRTTDQHEIYDSRGNRINCAGDIELESHIWLGARVTVMKNVVIGSGAMVGYGSLVTKSLPKNSMAVGFPAKVIKQDIVWSR